MVVEQVDDSSCAKSKPYRKESIEYPGNYKLGISFCIGASKD